MLFARVFLFLDIIVGSYSSCFFFFWNFVVVAVDLGCEKCIHSNEGASKLR